MANPKWSFGLFIRLLLSSKFSCSQFDKIIICTFVNNLPLPPLYYSDSSPPTTLNKFPSRISVSGIFCDRKFKNHILRAVWGSLDSN